MFLLILIGVPSLTYVPFFNLIESPGFALSINFWISLKLSLISVKFSLISTSSAYTVLISNIEKITAIKVINLKFDFFIWIPP